MQVETSYRPPLDRLLKLGQPGHAADVDYATMGIHREHVPELIHMATDPDLNDSPGDSLFLWAPVHVWRALGH